MKIMNVKGTVDSLPSKEIIRRKVVNTLTDTFEKYGGMECIECGSCASVCPVEAPKKED